MSRRYRKRRRAELEARTRQRITEATVELHGTVGPARTTVSGVAERAGVQRATVYRHFPDEASLFEACTAHYFALHPMPDPASWTAIDDPSARLRPALDDLYGWFRRTAGMLERTSRDAQVVEAMARPAAAFSAYLDVVAATILRGRRERGAKRRRVEAAIGHAIAFSTWQSLAQRQSLDDGEAVELVAAMIDGAASAGRTRRR